MVNFKTLVAAGALVLLAACGGGGGKAGTSPFLGNNSTGSSGSATNSAALTLSVALVDGSGATTTALVGSSTLRVQVVLKKGGVTQANELVQFSIEQSSNSAVLDQLTALTDLTGTAVVNLSAGTTAGAGQVKATAKLLDGTTVEGATNFVASPTAQSAKTLTLANFQTNSSLVSAYGTTGFQVSVLENGVIPTQPVTVTFSSDCAVGKATVTSSAQTNASGVAVGTFEDVGCATSSARNVLLTASISSNSAQKQIQVLPSTVGSLRFVSVSPSDASITLKGNGGVGRQENAQLTFRLVDQAGNGVKDTEVCFDSTTYIGGLTLDGFNDQPGKTPTTQGNAALCGSDSIAKIRYVKRTDISGNISIQIASGTIPTPVRIRARTIYPSTATTALETFSDSLSISTGLPLQRSMSLSVDKANIDAGNGTAGGGFDGDEANLTVRLADQFSNPVPDGTKVTFVASGGAVCTSQNGSCSTVNGVCSCKLVGQNRRPLDGRVVVLAYADGLEDYVDSNGDNSYTSGVDLFNADLADAFVDANKSGAYSGASVNGDTDIPISFQSPANYLSGDGVRSNVHIRASTIIYFSAPSGSGDPTVVIPNSSLSISTDLLTNTDSSKYIRMKVSNCSVIAPQTSFEAYLDDGYGNPMAAGTTVTASDFPENLAAKSVKPSAVLAFGAAAPNPLVDGPLNGNGGNVIKVIPWAPGAGASKGNVTTPHVVTIQGVKDKCIGNPSFVLDIVSPKGAGKSVRVLYEGEPRNTVPARRAFDVHYIDSGVQFSLNTNGTKVTTGVVSLTSASFTRLVLQGSFASYELDWGDGSVVQTGTTLPVSIQSHSYTTTGSKTVTLKVIDTAGATFIAEPQSVNVNP